MYFYLKDAKNEIYAIMNSSGNIIGTYSYDPYENILSISDTSSNSPLVINPFRYKGYYYDEETQLYWVSSRYYSPELCRFISPDNVKYLNAKSINGLNLYAYCDNDPVNKFDPSGCLPEWIKIVTDLAAYALSAIISTMVATAAVNIVSSLSPVPISGKQKFKIGLATFTATFSTINNLTNALYFTFISDEESDLTSSSYRSGYISRWDRLDYAKKNSKENWYNINAWRYYSEYNAHMYAWYLTGWAYEKNITLFSWLAFMAEDADVDDEKWDDRWYIKCFTAIVGLIGL